MIIVMSSRNSWQFSLLIPSIRAYARTDIVRLVHNDERPQTHARPQRTDRSALDAVKHVPKLLTTGHAQIVDADLSGYFDSIPHSDLLKSIARRVVDGAMLHLIKMWLEAPVRDRRARE